MKIEDHVTSFEISKKLKELKCPKDSIYFWTGNVIEYLIYGCESFVDQYNHGCNHIQCSCCRNSSFSENIYPAYLATELLSIMKLCLRITKNEDGNLISVYYQPEIGTDNSYAFSGTNLADLLAQVFIAQHAEDFK